MPFFGSGGGSAGVGGSTGATDNAILRADGTGGATLQNSDLNVDDATTTTQNNVTISNQHSGQTNSALVLTPKGTGAFIVGPKPDGTSTGGNARGANAIDIQTTRSAATQVASSTNAIAIGNRVTVSGGENPVAIGQGATASGTYGPIAIGSFASASGWHSIAIGSSSSDTGPRASGNYSIAIGRMSVVNAESALGIVGGDSAGSDSGATAVAATAIGGRGFRSANLRGQFLAYPFASVFWSGSTTNATATILNLDGTATNRFTIAANTAVIANLYIIARRTDTVDKWFSGQRKVAIRRNNANGTAIIGSVETIGTDQTEGSPSWTVAITADDTNEALQVEVTGAASETVSWRVMAFYQVV